MDIPQGAVPVPRRRFRRVVVSLLVGLSGTVLVPLVIHVVSTDRREARQWPEYERRVRVWTKAARDGTGARTPFRDPVEAGNAWDDYAPAFRACSDLSKLELEAVTAVVEEHGNEADEAAATQVLERFARVVGQLRAGSRKSEVTPPWAIDHPLPEPLPELRGARDAARILRLAARAQAKSGQVREAREICLDLLQIGCDLLRGPTLICSLLGQVQVIAACMELARLIPSLDQPTAVEAQEALAALDDRMPAFSHCLDSEFVAGLAGLREQQASIGLRERAFFAWKSGSSRLMQCECSARYEELLGSIRANENATWDVAQAAYGIPHADNRALGASLIDLLCPALQAGEASYRGARARLRMIRVVLLLRTGAPQSGPAWPTDPFDQKPLRAQTIDGMDEVICVWKDTLVSGAGNWTDPDRGGGDCVLRVPAKEE